MNPDAQLSLLEPPRHAEGEDAAWLENLLKQARAWVTATEILYSIGKPASEDQKRWLRRLASASCWIISGQKGYKHIEHATAEEIDHCANGLESQAKEMSDRAGGIRRNAHRIFG
jgi:hypothetical protein